ncbi:MAG: ABC transporter ATP-binding protein [Candidatus Hydrogenedentes bacterium]|nr:ABC transporter ATP-binding protein [Candidatus Hydrogenedentota bacterium]
MEPLLEIRGLTTVFPTDDGTVCAVNDVTFSITPGKTLGLVGESGCGKSLTALSILRLVPAPGRIAAGSIWYRPKGGNAPIDLVRLCPHGDAIREIRGNEIAMIFQEPMTSLNPVYTIGNQIAESVALHQAADRKEARARAVEMLARVGIPNPRQRAKEYPHQLSGGMRQRAMIAMALCCRPALLLADEPTTALDVTIQAQVLELMKSLQQEFGMAILLITHDMGVIAEMADEVVVMYAGRVVEQGEPEAIFYKPLHPYTQGLLASVPVLGRRSKARLVAIPGTVPRLQRLPQGCAFRPRCSRRMPVCVEMPELEGASGAADASPNADHKVRCWLYDHQHGR